MEGAVREAQYDCVFDFSVPDLAGYEGEVGVLVCCDVSGGQIPQLHVGPCSVTRAENMVAFGCNQFHTWHFQTRKASLVPGFTRLVRGGANEPLHTAVQSKAPANRCTEVKRFLDW